MKHELKTDSEVYQSVKSGYKTFEIRQDDRDYQFRDILILRETKYTGDEMKTGKPIEYTGRCCNVEVLHILRGPIYGLIDGWIIMSIRRFYKTNTEECTG